MSLIVLSIIRMIFQKSYNCYELYLQRVGGYGMCCILFALKNPNMFYYNKNNILQDILIEFSEGLPTENWIFRFI